MSADSSSQAPSSGREHAVVIGLVGLAHAASHFGHLLLPPLFPFFMQEFDLSFVQVGALTSLFFAVSGSGQILSGFVVDRVGARAMLFVALGLFLSASVTAALASSYAWLMLAAVLAGLANAPFHPVDFSILNQRVPAKRLGYAYSVHGLSGSLGWAFAPFLLVSVAHLSHWRHALWCAALLYLLVIALMYWQRQRLRTDVVVRQTDASAVSAVAFLREPVIWLCFLFFLLSTMSLAVIQNYSPSILHELYELPLQAGANTLSLYLFLMAVGGLCGGFLVSMDSSRSEPILASAMALGSVLMALAASQWFSASTSILVLVSAGFVFGLGGPSRDMMIRHATPAGATGRVYGAVYSGLDIGYMLSALSFGALMDLYFFQGTLFGAALVLMLSVVVVLSIRGVLSRRIATAS
jgi:FSR family fosmidomycin resistance protein-like MFS transporter